MTLRKLASTIAKMEGKKSQSRIGDIREILKIIVDYEVEHGAKDSGIMCLVGAVEAKVAKAAKKAKK